MRHSWRFLLLRSRHLRSNSLSHFPHFPSVQSAPNLSSVRHVSSFFASSQLTSFANPSAARGYTSEAAIELKDSDHMALVGDIFSKFEDLSDIRREIELHNVAITHDLILKVLKGLDASPDVARKFFGWVSDSNGERLSSKSYNSMLRILGFNGFDQEFWDLIEVMKRKGYGVSKGVRDKVLEKFEKEGRNSDMEKLRGVFASGSIDKSLEKMCARICRIVQNEAWSEEVEGKLRELNFEFSSDSVIMMLENLAAEPSKAFIFFKWLEESGCIEHDKRTFNAVARVLGREDSVDKFWKVVDEMRAAGYELEKDTYTIVLKRFLDRKMIKESVNLYEFAMGGSDKPSAQDCTFLLKKIAVSKSFDLALFSRVVNAFYEGGDGGVLTDTMLSAVVKSLASVSRLGKCNKVLKAMKENGYVPSSSMQSKIAFQLSSSGRKKQADDLIKVSGNNPDHQTWMSLIEGHCVAGDLEKASEYFKEMVKKEEGASVTNAFESLVSYYCRRNRAIDASKLMHDCISGDNLKPRHSTYKLLISKLLVQGGFKDALGLLSVMKSHGFPPFLDPFVEYISKSGTGGDAVAFSKAVTSKRFPSASVYIRLFEAFFEARRRKEAQEFLSKCPKHIRDHADVLNLFCPKSKGRVAVSS
ncbi:hypothetical protein CDL15_Pgr027479 [Punica granatum]|uniref:Pentatricopeptide repeat-containing protein At3g02490, mitochondrial-like n=1 Tax=Punica granatum TaxID=22663 RepID=A0A218XK38_PUNGR|nr:hypothetical protein CDL15_Pgr027479 [Punica granatum]